LWCVSRMRLGLREQCIDARWVEVWQYGSIYGDERRVD
jgi:hypothetical protein